MKPNDYFKDIDDYDFQQTKQIGYGGLIKTKKFSKKHMKPLNYDYRKIYPKPFNSSKAFQRQKRGKR